MKRSTLILLITAVSFCSGFAFKTITASHDKTNRMKKVIGIGGIFFKCKDPKKMREWYQKHLGLPVNDYGATFEWHEGEDSTKKASTQWSPFDEKTKYFEPSTKEFMINYRVDNLVELVEQLKKEGVVILDSIDVSEYGKFVHIMDAEGNKIELWEPGGE